MDSDDDEGGNDDVSVNLLLSSNDDDEEEKASKKRSRGKAKQSERWFHATCWNSPTTFIGSNSLNEYGVV
jgi:hypothetical protein